MAAQQQQRARHWRDAALERSQAITDAWEVTKTYAGRLAEWVLFGCMVMNILEILPGVRLWPAVSNVVLGTQVVMLDVGGFSLASMAEQAHEQGNERAARHASRTGFLLIGIMMLTLLLVTVGVLWPAARPYTDLAEKALILVRVVMTVLYSHVIHSLRRMGLQQQQVALSEMFAELSTRISESETRISEQCRELVNRTMTRYSVDFTEQLKRRVSEHATRKELANMSELVEAHSRLLGELATLPALFEERVQTSAEQMQAIIQHEVQAALLAKSEQRDHPAFGSSRRPNLSVVEANTEHRTAKTERTGGANRTDSDKGAFVRRCLSETPNVRNTDIARRAKEEGMLISPAYISEVRKAFVREAHTA